MTLHEQKNKLGELIKTGREMAFFAGVKAGRTRDFSDVLIPQDAFESWMGQINTFNDRYLNKHPQHDTIFTKFFHRKNFPNRCEEMVGILQAVYDDDEFWGEDVVGYSNHKAHSTYALKGSNLDMKHTIFISHRSTDVTVADMVRDYLVSTGIPNEYIFCSSLPGNDVQSCISAEVKENMRNSVVNIAILSQDYYDSAYCLNEAGVMWFCDTVPNITIGLPEIDTENMYGFLDKENKLRRLNNADDIATIYDIVRNAVNAKQTTIAVATAQSQKLISKYNDYISKRCSESEKSVSIETYTSKSCGIRFSLENITTDDEKIALYYVASKKIRKVDKSLFEIWLRDNELYDVNIENAFDLLSTLGNGYAEGDTVEIDVGLFRQCTIDNTVASELYPVFLKHQRLSSNCFARLWEKDIFNDEDKLFVAYIHENKVSSLGTRSFERGQLEDISIWEKKHSINGWLSTAYSSCLNMFIENNLVFPSDWTSYGNAREYTLNRSLRAMLFENEFAYCNELPEIIKKAGEKLPF